MNPLAFYLGAGLLTGFSVFLIKGTEPHAMVGCHQYEGKRNRRLIGKVVLVVAVLCLGIAMISQLTADGGE